MFSRIRSKNQKDGVLQGNAVFLYDPLNNLSLNFSFGKVEAEKKPFIENHIPFIKKGPVTDFLQNPILLFDKFFIDFGMFAVLIANNLKFCIRSKTSATFKVIVDFVNNQKTDSILEFKCSRSQKALLKKTTY
ncbi:hypothetical protein [Candidatus Harpocratesius sp.]